MSAHTPVPWRTESAEFPGCIIAPGPERGSSVRVATFHPIEQADFNFRAAREAMVANARFAVRAVNSHEELLEALKNAVSMNFGNAGLRGDHDSIGWVRVARAAIAKAEGVK